MNSKLSAILFLSFLSLSLLTFHIPAVESFEVHDVAVTDVTVFPGGSVYPGISVSTHVAVENQGTSNETFNITLYAGNLTIQTLTVTHLTPESNITLTFEWTIFPFRIMIFPPPWDPTEIMSKNLTLKAEADVVPGEIDTADNVYIDGLINVLWMVPDVNGDGKIDMRDIGPVGRAFGSSPGNPRWDPMVDFNSDGKIDMRDVGTSARMYGTHYS